MLVVLLICKSAEPTPDIKPELKEKSPVTCKLAFVPSACLTYNVPPLATIPVAAP